MFDLFSEIWQTMRTNKLRTFLTGIAVAWGILMLIVLLSVSNGIINSFRQNTADSDIYQSSVWASRTTIPYQGYKEGRWIQLKDDDIKALDDIRLPGYDGATPQYSFKAEVSTSRDYLPSTWCEGMCSRDFDLDIIAGRAFNSSDDREARKVIILPSTSLSTLFADTTDVVGRTVKAGGVALTVVGVYSSRFRSNIYIPYSTSQALTGFTGDVDNINLHYKEGTTIEQAKAIDEEAKKILRQRHTVSPDDDSAIGIWNALENNKENLAGLNILNVTMWIIGILTLITGIVGVSNIMFVSVRERTHEIGIRRAIGARPRNILTQIVLESVVMTTFFGYLGIVGGTLLTEIVKAAFAGSEFMLNPSVDLGIAFEVTIALVIAGALAGIFPAMRALKIKPVEALSEE